VTHAGITCFRCGARGHYISACPRPDTAGNTTGVGLLQLGEIEDAPDPNEDFDYDVLFTQSDDRYDVIPPHWILLDSQLTVCVFKTKEFLQNIRPSPRRLRLLRNGGS
jgi:hypothetical protein